MASDKANEKQIRVGVKNALTCCFSALHNVRYPLNNTPFVFFIKMIHIAKQKHVSVAGT